MKTSAVILTILLAMSAFGQNLNSTLAGKVTDRNGAAIVGALIVLTEIPSRKESTAATEENGEFRFPNVPNGSYQITVKAAGFRQKTEVFGQMAGTANTIDLILEVGGVSSSVTVTALKREEEEVRVPATVSAISRRQIEQSNILTTKELPDLVPNLRFVDSGARNDLAFVIMRGYTISTAATDTSTAVYIDGVPLNDLYSFNQNLFDVEQVEVLKGPQGTLYGGNSEAGVIKITTRQPTNDYRGFVNATYGQFNTYNTSLGVSGPVLKDKLLFSLTGGVNGNGGYLRNLVSGTRKDNSQFDFGGRIRLLYIPNEKLTVGLTGYGRGISDRGGFLEPPINLDSYNQFLRSRGFTNLTAGKWDYAVNYGGLNRSRLHGEALQVDYRTKFVDIAYTFAHRKNNTRTAQDADGLPIRNFLADIRGAFQEFNNEFQFRSPDISASRFSWIAGAQISRLNQYYDTPTTYLPGNPFEPFGGLGTIDSSGISRIKGRSYAVFGQGTTRFFNNRLGITLGLRWNRSDRSIDRGPSTFVGSPFFLFFPRTQATYSDDIWLPKAAIDCRIGENALVYASAGRGWKTGGLNQYSATPDLLRYGKQTSWTYETGAKVNFAGNRIALRGAVFYTDGRDFQENISDNFFNFYFANAVSVSMFGADLEATFAPVSGLEINTTYGPIRTRYKNYQVFQTGAFSYSGKPLRYVPDYDAGLTMNYRFQNQKLKNIYVRGEAFLTGRFFDYRNNFVTNQVETTALGKYTILNIGAGYEKERWNVGFYVNNLADKRYFIRPFFLGSFSGYPEPFGIIGTRRVVAVKTSYRF